MLERVKGNHELMSYVGRRFLNNINLYLLALYNAGAYISRAVVKGETVFFTLDGRPFYLSDSGRRVYLKPDTKVSHFKYYSRGIQYEIPISSFIPVDTMLIDTHTTPSIEAKIEDVFNSLYNK